MAILQFEYWHEPGPLFNMSNLATRDWNASYTEPSVGQWDPEVKLLNYPVDDKYPYSCEVYDIKCEQPNEADTQASMPLKAMYGSCGHLDRINF